MASAPDDGGAAAGRAHQLSELRAAWERQLLRTHLARNGEAGPLP